MDIVGWIALSITVIACVVFAVFLFNGKGGFLLAGFNTMSVEKKANYDMKAVCRYAGWVVISIAVWLMFFVIGLEMHLPWWEHIMLPIMFAGIIGAAIYANTGKRLYKKEGSETVALNENANAKTTNGKKA